VTSFLTITAITVDRFLALKLHLRYHQVVTTQKATFAAVCIWFCGIFWGSIYGQWKGKIVVRILDNTMALMILAIDFYLMFRIATVIRRHSIQIFNQQQLSQPQGIAPVSITTSSYTITDLPKYKKTVNTMHYIMGIFLACYVPVTIVVIIDSIKKDVKEVVFGLTVFADFLLMFNSVLNPIIYCLRIHDIRVAMVRLLRCRSVRG